MIKYTIRGCCAHAAALALASGFGWRERERAGMCVARERGGKERLTQDTLNIVAFELCGKGR